MHDEDNNDSTGFDDNEVKGEDYWVYNEADFYNNEEEEEKTESLTNTILSYIMAAIVLLAFIALSIFSYWPQKAPDLSPLLNSSADLKKELAPEILAAVVRVETVTIPGTGQRQGTGFNISPSGVIVTNHHVIADADRVKVLFGQNRMFYAAYWVSNPELDLALVFLNNTGLPTLDLSAADPEPGQEVTIIGNPLGINQVVTPGEILGKVQVNMLTSEAIAVKAPIYPGNSGSPLLNDRQQVMGVVFGTIKNDSSAPEDIIALAMPVSQLSSWAENNSD